MVGYVLKPIGDSSWILQDAQAQRVALVSMIDGVWTAIGLDRRNFTGIDDLTAYLGHPILIHDPPREDDDDETGELSMVCGFPVKYRQVFDVREEPVPNYTKKQGSRIRYAAGYFGIGFERGWTQTFCPKLVTLANNDYVGPFATRLEMHNSMSQVKREARKKDRS